MLFQCSLYENNNFMTIDIFLKMKYIIGFKMIRGTSTYKLSSKTFSLRPINIKNTRHLSEIVQKRPFLTFAVLVAKF